MKRLSAILSTLALLVGLIPAATVAASAESAVPKTQISISSDDTTVTVGDETYSIIRKASDLPSSKTENGRYILANDIDFSAESISSVKVQLGSNSIFDGNGYGLLNFSLTAQQLFELDSAVTVRNLSVGSADQKVTCTPSGAFGIFGGWNNSGSATFENVQIFATINQTINQPAGGFVGYFGSVSFKNCVSNVSITGSSNGQHGYGGFAAYPGENVSFDNCFHYGDITVTGTSSNCRVGGFVGQWGAIKTLQVQNSANYGNITTTDSADYVGGIIPGFESTMTTANFTNVKNYGAITGANKVGGIVGRVNSSAIVYFNHVANYGAVNSKKSNGDGVGGLVGGLEGTSCNVTVSDCANYGDLISNVGKNRGGLVGYWGGKMLTVNGFLNMGDIKQSQSYCGGVIGNAAKTVTLENCVSLGDLSGQSETGGLIGNVGEGATVKNCLSAGTVEYYNPKWGNLTCGALFGSGASMVTASDNFYWVQQGFAELNQTSVSVDGKDKTVKTNVDGGAALADWAAVVTKLNAEPFGKVWGGFKLNATSDGAVLATPTFVGIQDGVENNGTFSVRLVAVLQDTLDYERVGFKISANSGEMVSYSCKSVYTTLLATENGKQTQLTAESLGGAYIYALSVNGIPTSGTVTFTVTAFADDMGNAVGADDHVGTTYTITYVDGVYQSASANA